MSKVKDTFSLSSLFEILINIIIILLTWALCASVIVQWKSDVVTALSGKDMDEFGDMTWSYCVIMRVLHLDTNHTVNPEPALWSAELQLINTLPRLCDESFPSNIKSSKWSLMNWFSVEIDSSILSVQNKKTQFVRFSHLQYFRPKSEETHRPTHTHTDTQCALVRNHTPLKNQTVWQCFLHLAA